MQPGLSPDLMRAYRRFGADSRPLDRNEAHLLDLRNAQREAMQDPPQRPRRALGWPLWIALLLQRRPA